MNLQQRSRHPYYYVNMDLAFLGPYEYRVLGARVLKKRDLTDIGPYAYSMLEVH